MKGSHFYPRYLKMKLPTGQSAFLWGVRKTVLYKFILIFLMVKIKEAK